MKKRKILIRIIGLAFVIMVSCSGEEVGYVEVRNHLDSEISKVSWGETVFLGTIAPGEEAGEETPLFGSQYITLHAKELPTNPGSWSGWMPTAAPPWSLKI